MNCNVLLYLSPMKSTRLLMALVAWIVTSCATPKDILYFQDIDKVKLEKLTTKYEAVIKKDDILTIVVTGPDKNVIAPYNLSLHDFANGTGGNGDPERSTLGYLVDPDGNIDFPVIGKIHVEGMTRKMLVEYLASEIGKDVKDPIVYVSFRNYKVTVIGEVRSPGTYTMGSEKVNVLQALSMAGDLSLTAKRDGVLLIREEDGRIVHHTLDLRDSHLLDSPYFFLQQNDVLYIPPSPGRVATATNSSGVWTSIVASVSSTLAVLATILTLVGRK